MGRLILIAVRNLLLNKRRSLLLGGATVAVAMLLVLLAALGAGIQDTMLKSGTAIMTGHVNVGGFYKITSGQAIPALTYTNQLLKDVKEIYPDARQIVDRRRGFGKVVSNSDTILASLTGIDIMEEEVLRSVLRVAEGELDDLANPRTIMLFEPQAERLNVAVGDEVTLSAPVMRGQNNSLDVTVAVIAKDMGLITFMSSFVSKDTIRDLYEMDNDTTGVIFIYLDDEDDAEDVQGHIRAGLLDKEYRIMDRQEGPFFHKFNLVQGEDWTGQKLDVTTWEDELSGLQWTLKTFDTVTTILIGVLLVIIVVGVMNAMWINVRDRTREIGTLRAIGMGRARVLVMFVLETIILSAVAAAVGVALGAGITHLLNAAQIPVSRGFQIFLMSDTLRMAVSVDSALVALIAIPLLTTIGAFFPAMRAANLKPVTAMHHVG